ncbi:hypothetical protein NL676_001407 [Syzygium grande]|nr:hypothetical protein NL676_001407 [Syzygium grande]
MGVGAWALDIEIPTKVELATLPNQRRCDDRLLERVDLVGLGSGWIVLFEHSSGAYERGAKEIRYGGVFLNLFYWLCRLCSTNSLQMEREEPTHLEDPAYTASSSLTSPHEFTCSETITSSVLARKLEWEDALQEVSFLKGWESEKTNNGYEGALVKTVVRKEAIDVLDNNKGTRKNEALCLGKYGRERIYTTETFKELTNLRFLQFDGANFTGDFQNLLPQLRWLHGCIVPQFRGDQLSFKGISRARSIMESITEDLGRMGSAQDGNQTQSSQPHEKRFILLSGDIKTLASLNICKCYKPKELPAGVELSAVVTSGCSRDHILVLVRYRGDQCPLTRQNLSLDSGRNEAGSPGESSVLEANLQETSRVYREMKHHFQEAAEMWWCK